MQEDADILMGKIRKGDREAFMTLTRLYQKKVFLLAFSFFRNKEDALDVVQETFFRLYQKAHLYQRGKNFQNWILHIAKNICIDYYRKNYNHQNEYEKAKNLDEMSVHTIGEERLHHSIDLKDIVSLCLERLSEKQRMIFVMKHYNQLEYREIAEVLDLALGTVKSLHFKAVQNLRALMNPYLGRQT